MMRLPVCVALILAVACAPLAAQTVVSMGVGLAHNCFIAAKAGLDPRGGIEVCTLAMAREPLTPKDLAATYDNRGVMLDRLDRVDEAAKDFHRSMDLDPSLGDPHVNLGATLIKQRRYDEALAQINTGIELGLSFPQIGYYDRAVAYHQMGKLKEAYFDYKKVLEIDPGFTAASEQLKYFVVTRTPVQAPAQKQPG